MLTKVVPLLQGTVGADKSITMRIYKVFPGTYDLIPIQPSDVRSITEVGTDLRDGSTVLFTNDLTPVSSFILTALSTGSLWLHDTIGFNFVRQVPGSFMTNQPGVRLTYDLILNDSTVVSQSFDVALSSP